MTALEQYARLETVGLWRPAPDAQRREVVVSFGAATLVMSDTAGRALAHWSLPAVLRLNPGDAPALYSPDAGADEVLEIEDMTMVAAIETVRQSLHRALPRPGRLRQVGWTVVVAGAALAGFLWLPGALTRQAQASLPQATRVEIGATLLGHLQRLTGPTCREPLAMVALARLSERLFGPGGMQIVVVPQGLAVPQALPGGIIVLPQEVIASREDPAVMAGQAVVTALGPGGKDPLGALLDQAGLGATLRLLARGTLPDDVLADAATDMTVATALPFDAATLGPAFAAAALSPAPWQAAVDPGGTRIGPIPVPPGPLEPLISDGDWLALQGICDV